MNPSWGCKVAHTGRIIDDQVVAAKLNDLWRQYMALSYAPEHLRTPEALDDARKKFDKDHTETRHHILMGKTVGGKS